MKPELGKAYAAAVLNAVIVGLSFLFLKISLVDASPLDTLAHRFTFSIIAVVILVLLRIIKINMSWKHILRIMPLGILYPALFFGFQSFGLLHATSSEGGILMALVPIFTVFLASLFLKERTNWGQKLSILLSVAGVMFILIMQGASIQFDHLTGLFLLLLSVLSLAGYSVLARPLAKQYKPMDMTCMMLGIGFVVFNLAAIIPHLANGTMHEFFIPLKQPKFLLSIIYLGVLSSLVTAFLSNYALSKLEAYKMSVFGNLGTIITIASGVIFLNEPLYSYHWIGAVMILAGVIGTNILGRTTRQKDDSSKPVSSAR